MKRSTWYWSGAAILVVFAVIAGVLLSRGPIQPEAGFVQREWSKNVGELSLTPVFPPRENIYVGDIFVTFKPLYDSKLPDVAYLQPALWFDSIDMHPEDFYSTRNVFPKTDYLVNTSLSDGSVMWQQPLDPIGAPAKDSGERLRLVSFPAFAFASTTQSAAGARSIVGKLMVSLGLAKSDSYTLTLSVPAAVSYGVPATTALTAFEQTCSQNPTLYRQRFSDVANMLSEPTDQPAGKTDPILTIVTEVYYARAIDYTFASESDLAANIAASTPAQPKQGAPAEPHDSQAPQNGAASGGQADNETAQHALAAVPRIPGVSARVISVSKSSVTLRQTFERPVAIGYRKLTLTDASRAGGSSGNFVGALCGFRGIETTYNVAPKGSPSVIARRMPVAAPLPAPAAAPARSYLVFFDPNAAALTDRARQIIAEAASMTKAIHVRQFIVTGYTDAVGTPSDRYAIALERAKTVADQLVADGADRSILSVGSYGSTYQLVPDPDGTAVPQNRRVEIIIQ